MTRSTRHVGHSSPWEARLSTMMGSFLGNVGASVIRRAARRRWFDGAAMLPRRSPWQPGLPAQEIEKRRVLLSHGPPQTLAHHAAEQAADDASTFDRMVNAAAVRDRFDPVAFVADRTSGGEGK